MPFVHPLFKAGSLPWTIEFKESVFPITFSIEARNKVADYFIDDYPQKLATMLERLPDIIKGDAFRNEMARFIPQDVQERTLHKEKFFVFLTAEITGLLQQVQRDFQGNSAPEF